MYPQGNSRHGRSVNTWKDGIRHIKQRRNLKGEESFDPEFWKEKNMSLG
jgi:hypothetical protein